MLPKENFDFGQQEEKLDNNGFECPSDDEDMLIKDYINKYCQVMVDDEENLYTKDILSIMEGEIDQILAESTNTNAKDYLFNLGSDCSVKLNALSPELLGQSISSYKIFKLFLTDELVTLFTNTRNYARAMLDKYNQKEDRKQFATDVSHIKLSHSSCRCTGWLWILKAVSENILKLCQHKAFVQITN